MASSMELAKGLSSSHHFTHSKSASGFFRRVTWSFAFMTLRKFNDAQIQVVSQVIVKVVSPLGPTVGLIRSLDSIIKGMKVRHALFAFFPVSFVSLLMMIRANRTIAMISSTLALTFIGPHLILTFCITDPPVATICLNKGTLCRITQSTKRSLVCTIVLDMIFFAVVVSTTGDIMIRWPGGPLLLTCRRMPVNKSRSVIVGRRSEKTICRDEASCRLRWRLERITGSSLLNESCSLS